MSDQPAANFTCERIVRLAAVALAAIFLGCSNAKFGEVAGQVTLDGKPLPQVAVRFEDERGSATIARTDQNGNYVLRYTVHQLGAPIGKHKVTIFTPAPETEGTGERAKAEIVPAKYNRNSTLIQEIKRGSQTINFELTSKP
jgi:phosphatidate phosphatase APP1